MKQAWTLLETLTAMTIILFFMGIWSQIVHQAILKNQSRKEMVWILQSMDIWTQAVTTKGYHAYQDRENHESFMTSPSGKKFILKYQTHFDAASYSKQITFEVFTSTTRTQIAKWFALLETTPL